MPLSSERVSEDDWSPTFKVIVTASDALSSTDCELNFVCVYVNDNRITGVMKTFGSILGSLNILLSICAILWTIANRNETVVRYSQAVFLILIAIGCIASSTSIFFLSVEDSSDNNMSAQDSADFACQILPWTYSLGFALTFASLFAKLRKVLLVFAQSKALANIRISSATVFMWILVVVILDASILLVWSIKDPMGYQRSIVDTDEYGYATEKQGIMFV